MKRHYLRYSSEDIINIAKSVKSMSELLKCLGLKQAGGNFINMKKKLQLLGIDCEHWTGQAWSKGQRLKDWSKYSKMEYVKTHMVKERGHVCEYCKKSKWMGSKIPLEIHHIDGDRTNNKNDNLKLCCCNCHALTSNWRKQKQMSS